MKSNGASGSPSYVSPAGQLLSHVIWQTERPIELPTGPVQARGDAMPQVRSPEKLAGLGADPAQQAAAISQIIVEALAGALIGIEPMAEDLLARRDEIASLTLVAANMKLGAVGVALLDLRIAALSSASPSP